MTNLSEDVPAAQPDDSQRDFWNRYYALHHADESEGGGQRWRAKLAQTNAVALERLLGGKRRRPIGRVVEIGCGDGALLAELSKRGLFSRAAAYEVSETAADFVRSRGIAGLEYVRAFDGSDVPEPDGAFELVIISHVLEHAVEPNRLVSEARRLAPTLALQVQLTDTWLARGRAHRQDAAKLGRVHAFNRQEVRGMLGEAGLQREAERVSVSPMELRTFWDDSLRRRLKGHANILLHGTVPGLSRRLFACDYGVLASRP